MPQHPLSVYFSPAARRYATTTRLAIRDLSALLTDAGDLVVPADTYADLEIAELFTGRVP
jgi:hypothetical protein